MSAQASQFFRSRKRHGEEGRFREATAAQAPLPTRGTMFTKPLPGGRVLEPRREQSSASTPRHPFQLYQTTFDGESWWTVYPATVNGTIEPEIDGISVFTLPVPLLTLLSDFSAFLEFDVKGETKLVDGIWITLPGKTTITNVKISSDPDEATEIYIDPETGEATPGHRVYQIGQVEAGAVIEQTRRFSVYFALCSDGNLIMSEYG